MSAAFDRILAGHEPLPGVVMDRHWNLVRANNGAQKLFGQLIDLAAVEPPVNVLRLVFGPLRPHIDNWDELAPNLIARARREAVGAIPDTTLAELLDALTASLPDTPHPSVGHGPVIDVAFRIGGTVHRYFSTVTHPRYSPRREPPGSTHGAVPRARTLIRVAHAGVPSSGHQATH